MMKSNLEFGSSQNEEYNWQLQRKTHSSSSNDKNLKGESGSSSSSCFSLGLYPTISNSNNNNKRSERGNKYRKTGGGFVLEDDDDDDGGGGVCRVVPAVTVVVEGRSICHRIGLHNHGSYQSLAKALRHMLVDDHDHDHGDGDDDNVDLSNAIPGHIVAYEDMDNDLLLAGDLNWKDFVRVAKRIRIVPAKRNSRKSTRGG